MALVAEHNCPQCGAPVEFEETSRLLKCPYCDVENYMFTHRCFRFILPHKTSNKNIVWVPYMRFRGTVYLCENISVNHRFVDITRIGTTFGNFPPSLGLRPQAVRMKFVTPDLEGTFLSCPLSVEDMLDTVERRDLRVSRNFFHRACIGDALSIIYLPVYIERERIFDAVTNRFSAVLPGGSDSLKESLEDGPKWKITFMATMCPNCGWGLKGERDSVVFICENCDTAWEASESGFSAVDLMIVSGDEKDGTLYLPFWKMAVKSVGKLEINSYADFIRATNQPRVILEDWENQEMFFWAPAFKIRPAIFLNLSKQLTVLRRDFDFTGRIETGSFYPATLPLSEAFESIKITLANSIMNKRKMFSFLPEMNFKMEKATLVYLPFNDAGQEIIQKHMHISIHKKTLEYGRYL